MPYPANFLADRIFAVITAPKRLLDQDINPKVLLRQAVQRLEDTGLTQQQAIAALAAFGEGYGTGGELGGIDVYDLGRNRGSIQWTLPGEGIFCSFGTLLVLSQDVYDIPEWYKDEWMLVKDDNGGWIRLIDRDQEGLLNGEQ
jgi:hypothetical protein